MVRQSSVEIETGLSFRRWAGQGGEDEAAGAGEDGEQAGLGAGGGQGEARAGRGQAEPARRAGRRQGGRAEADRAPAVVVVLRVLAQAAADVQLRGEGELLRVQMSEACF